jgi:hypothetical protein
MLALASNAIKRSRFDFVRDIGHSISAKRPRPARRSRRRSSGTIRASAA